MGDTKRHILQNSTQVPNDSIFHEKLSISFLKVKVKVNIKSHKLQCIRPNEKMKMSEKLISSIEAMTSTKIWLPSFVKFKIWKTFVFSMSKLMSDWCKKQVYLVFQSRRLVRSFRSYSCVYYFCIFMKCFDRPGLQVSLTHEMLHQNWHLINPR